MKLLRIFFTGMLISFLGTLPLGTLNIAAMQIAISDGTNAGIYFILGALLVEIIYVRISLVAINWVMQQQKLFRWLEVLSVLIVFALAISNFVAAADPVVKKNILLSNTVHRFWLGIIMSAVNPVQIPFWFGWSTVLFTRNILEHKNSHFNAYILGIGLGTLTGNMIFIFGGRYVADELNANQQVLQWIIGCVFAITAIIMCWKMWKNKSSFSKLKNSAADVNV
ncbi:MAG: LysE family transporter [Flavitalea sp.]